MQRRVVILVIVVLALGLAPAASAGPDLATWNLASATFGQFRDGGRYYRVYGAQVTQGDGSIETYVFIGRGKCDVRYEDGVKLTSCKAPMELHYISDDDLAFDPLAAGAALRTKIGPKRYRVDWTATDEPSDIHVFPDYHASPEYGVDVWLEFYRYAEVGAVGLYKPKLKGLKRSGYVSTARAATEDPTDLMDNVRQRGDGTWVSFTKVFKPSSPDS